MSQFGDYCRLKAKAARVEADAYAIYPHWSCIEEKERVIEASNRLAREYDEMAREDEARATTVEQP